MKWLLCTTLFLRAGAVCVPVQGEQILVRDLALVLPAFESAPPDQVVSFAPLPGAQRVFKAKEVWMLSRRLGVNLDPTSVKDTCFVREAIPLNAEDIQKAMQLAIGGGAEIEVVEFSRYSLPAGRLEFRLSGASRISPVMADDTPIFWRGRLVPESGSHSFPVWAKARITLPRMTLAAKTELPQGHVLVAEDISTTPAQRSPFRDEFVLKAEAAIGKKLKRGMKAGEPFAAASLEEPKVVMEGEYVHVVSTDGEAQVSFEARAQTGGRKGDIILIQNPLNGHSFHSRVIEKGKVEAVASLQK